MLLRELLSENAARDLYKRIIDNEGQLGWMKKQLNDYIRQYGVTKATALIQQWYDEDKISEEVAESLLDYCSKQHPRKKEIKLK